VWDQSNWEKALWQPELTFRPVVELIESTAAKYGREAFVDEIVELPCAIQMSFEVDGRGCITFGEPATRDRRAVALAHAVQRTIRGLTREEAARLITQIDEADDDGIVRRKVAIRWGRQTQSVAEQIKRLHSAVLSKSPFAIEAAWFGLTPRAHEYLSVGYEIARRRDELKHYQGALEVPATVVPVPMVAPDLLKVILPHAVRAVALPGSRPIHPRDEALATILGIFNDISGTSTGSARRGDHDGPAGPGADFVRRIEEIFGVKLMAKGSTHAVARAKRRMAKRPD
jgi:hypothetical protein